MNEENIKRRRPKDSYLSNDFGPSRKRPSCDISKEDSQWYGDNDPLNLFEVNNKTKVDSHVLRSDHANKLGTHFLSYGRDVDHCFCDKKDESLLDVLTPLVPPGFTEGLRVLFSHQLLPDQIKEKYGRGDFEQDVQVIAALDQLGYGTGEANDGSYGSGNGDIPSFIRLLFSYVSVELSHSNFLLTDLLKRLIAVHIFRHLKAYHFNQSLERRNGWSKCRVLILTPTLQSCKDWIRYCHMVTGATVQETPKSKIFQKWFEAGVTPDFSAPCDLDELGGEMISKGNRRKPLDFVDTFRGNNHDSFAIGMNVEDNSIVLSKALSSCDAVIASPLGVRLAVEGRKDTEGDFLSSLEILVVDRADTFEAQCLEHLWDALKLCNKPPKKSCSTVDISTVRRYHIDDDEDKSIMARQTIVLTNGRSLQIDALISRFDRNVRGLVKMWRPSSGLVSQLVATKLAEGLFAFRGDTSGKSSFAQVFAAFEKHFLVQIHPRFAEDTFIVVVPSFLEYHEVYKCLERGATTSQFVGINENSSFKDILERRKSFKRNEVPILLTTERLLFYRRFRIGAKHIVWVSPPAHTSILLSMADDCSQLMAKAGKSTGLCLVYWDDRLHAAEMERVVGKAKMGSLRQKSNQLICIKRLDSDAKVHP